MSDHVLSILVKAVGTAQAAKNLRGIDAAVSGIGAKAGKGIRTATNNLKTMGVVAGGIVAAGLVASVKAAADFQSQLNTINTVAGLTDSQLAKVGDGIRGLARDTGAELSDLTGAYYDLVSAGIKPGADALKVLTLANTLAIGGLATTGETVDLLTTAINTYGLNAKGAAKATDQFAEAIALGKVTAAEIAESFSVVGPLAQAMGIGIDEISASYAQLTAKGVPAAEAMTDMRSALAGLAKPTATLTAAQKKLGVNFAKIAKEKGLQVALAQIRAYSDKTGIPLAKLLGRIEAVQYTLSTTGNNAADYNAALKKVQSASGTAADQMSERQKGLNYQLALLKSNARDAAITIGSKLLPKLTPLVQKAVAFLQTHESDISAFGDRIAGAFDKAVQFAEKIPWDAVGRGLSVAADWAGKLMDTFAHLPPDVQATIIALAGLNKLSGGAVTGIIGELGKGLIKGVLGMTAGVVNINAGVVNGAGGVGGAAGAAAAGGSKLGGLGSIITKLAGLAVAGGGSALLGAGAQQGGPAGAGMAALGGAGMIGGLAVAFGPAGAIVGSIAAVGQTLLSIRDQSSHQAADIGTAINAQIAGGAKLSDLKQSLAGVNAGINEIQANPLNVLVAGDALDQLRAQRDLLQTQIGNQQIQIGSSERGSDQLAGLQQNVAGLTDRADEQIGRLAGVATATYNAGTKTAAAAATAGLAAKAGGLAAAAAVRAKDLSFALTTVLPAITVIAKVSARESSKVQTTQKRGYSTLS